MKGKGNPLLSVDLAWFSGYRAAVRSAWEEGKVSSIPVAVIDLVVSAIVHSISRRSDQPMLAALFSKKIQDDLTSLAG